MANKPTGWVQDPSNPLRMTYTDEAGGTHEAFREAPSWRPDPSNPNRMTYEDLDGTVHEAFKEEPREAIFFDERKPWEGLSPEVSQGWADVHRKPGVTRDEILGYARQNRINVNPADVDTFLTRRAANPNAPISSVANYRSVAPLKTDLKDGTLGAAVRGIADPMNVLDEMSGVVRALDPNNEDSVWNGGRFGDAYQKYADEMRGVLRNDDEQHTVARFLGQMASGVALPGAAIEGAAGRAGAKALAEGATEFAAAQTARNAGLINAGRAGAIEGGLAGAGAGEDWQSRVEGALGGTALGAGLGVAADVGLNAAGTALKKTFAKPVKEPLNLRENWTPDVSYRTKTEEAAYRRAVAKGQEPDATIAEKQSFTSMSDRKKASAANRVQDIQNRVAIITRDWKNAPEFEVVHGVEDIADETVRKQAIAEGADADALGFLGPDGKVRILAKNIQDPSEVPAITYHEALGHYGLNQKFGEDLEALLGKFYDSNLGGYRSQVDGWLKANPEGYKGDPLRTLRAAEEVLAQWSEKGALPVQLKDRFANLVKDYGRKAGLDLHYSDREIRTILGMANDAVINGKQGNALANGFRYARVYHGSPHDFDAFDHSKMGSGEGAQVYGWGTYLTDREIVAEHYRGKESAKRGVEGRTYEVEIPNEGWLEWDKSVSQQPKVIEALRKEGFDILTKDEKEALTAEFKDLQDKVVKTYSGDVEFTAIRDKYLDVNEKLNNSVTAEKTAGDLYNELGFRYGDREISKALNRQGIVGNKYLDAGSRGTGKGTYNYVVFNEADAPIVNKYMRRRQKVGDDSDNPSGAMLAGNINLDRMSTANDVSEILDNLAVKNPGSTKSWAETKKEARALGLNANRIAKGRGVGNVSAQITAYRQVQTDILDRVAELSQRLETNGFNEVDHANYIAKMMQLNAVHARVSGDISEIGRALNALKIVTKSNKRSGEILEALKEAGGSLADLSDPNVFMRFVRQNQQMIQQGNSAGASAAMRTTLKPYWEDYILTGRHAMMLSGLGTHYKNFRDNLNIIGREYAEAGMTMLTTGGRSVTPQEMAGRTYGILRAMLDSGTYKESWKSFKEGYGNTAVNSKIDIAPAHIPVIDTPLRMLQASDTFFRSFAESSNMYALGVREAKKAGFKGTQMFEEGSARALNPTPEMLKEARELTDIALLVNKPGFSFDILEAAKSRKLNMSAQQRFGRAMAHILLPFFRTTQNLLYQQLRRSPLAFLDPVTMADLKAGGVKRSIAINRWILGTAITGYFWKEAGEGLISGDATPYEKQRALEPGGYKANSYKHGDKNVDATALNTSFPNLFGLDNNTAAMVASVREAWEKSGRKDPESYGKAVAKASAEVVRQLASQSFAEGLKPYADALFQSNRPGQEDTAWATASGGLASSMTPALARQLNNAYGDTEKRDYTGDRSFSDRVKGRIEAGIPGLSDKYPLKYDVYGQKMEKGANWSGVGAETKISRDPTVKEMQRLERTLPDKPIVTAAKRSFTKDGAKVTLTGETYAEFQRVQGYYLLEMMKQVVKLPEYKSLSDREKRDLMREAQSEAVKATKEYIEPMLKPEDISDPEAEK